MTHLDFETHRKRDYRLKCVKCKIWMRDVPNEKAPATRQSPPNAGHCTDCVKKIGK